MAREIDGIPDDVLYQVCALMFRQGQSMTDITEWLRTNGYPAAKREWPRQILSRAFDRGILKLPHREDYELGMRIQRGSGTACRVLAAERPFRATFEAVAELAADQVLHLIRQVQATGQDVDPPINEVHMGLAADGTSREFAARLARMLEGERDLPQLVLHTLTSGFFIDNPNAAPVVSLGEFSEVEPVPRYVVLFSEPLVSREEAKRLPERPFTREPFEAAAKLDIIVTSVSVAAHSHSLFQSALMHEQPKRGKQRLSALQRQGWAGDIMWQPYSEQGHFIDSDVRPVTVVDFDDLLRLSNRPSKHVVCIAGPCADCGMTKQEAVMPLMRCAKTRRPFNYLVTTESTAREICETLGW